MDRDNLPEDAVLVCPACGRTAQHPKDFDDVSCYLHCVVCHKDKIDGFWIPYKDHPDAQEA